MKVKLYDGFNVVREIVDCNDINHICNSCDRKSASVEVHMRDHSTKLCEDVVFMLEGEEE